MGRGFFRLTLLVGLLLSTDTCATSKGLVFRDDCSTVSGPSTEKILCFDRTAGSLKIYDGTRFISDVSEYGVLNVKDFGVSASATAKANTLALKTVNAAVTNGSTIFFPPGSFQILPGISYTLDTQTGDHNGVGDTIIQVTEAIDTTLTPSSGTLRVQVEALCSYCDGAAYIDVNYSSNAAGVPGRFTLTAALAQNLTATYTASHIGNDVLNFDRRSDIHVFGAGVEATEMKFASNASGRFIRMGNCSYCEVAYMKGTGQNVNGYPYEQSFSAAGDGNYNGANHIHYHHLHLYKLSQFVYAGTQSTDHEFDHFVCEHVHACIQAGAAPGDANAMRRFNVHDFYYKGDPNGTDDAFYFGAPFYDIRVSGGVIDKGNESATPHTQYAHRGNCLVFVSESAGDKLKGVRVSDIVCRNGATIEYIGPPEVQTENANPGGGLQVWACCAGSTVEDVQVRNFSCAVLRRCLRVGSTDGDTDQVRDIQLTGITSEDTSLNGFQFVKVQGLRLANFKISKHSQYQAAQGIFHTAMTDMDIHDGVIDGSGAVPTSLGIQNGYPISGAIRRVKALNNPSDGFWFPATDIGGPFEFTDNIAEDNGRYGFNGNNRVTARNGLVLRNNTGTGNKVGLFNGF